MPVRINKTTVERYTLRSNKPHWWADITISKDGFLNIQSDYGNFAYAWGSFGDDFKKFLMGCDNSYLGGKIGRDHPDEFNAADTLKAIKKDILEKRRLNDIKKEDARDVWDELRILGIDSRESLYRDLPMVSQFYDHDYSAIPCIMDRNYSITAFLEKCWPAFIEALKGELT